MNVLQTLSQRLFWKYVIAIGLAVTVCAYVGRLLSPRIAYTWDAAFYAAFCIFIAVLAVVAISNRAQNSTHRFSRFILTYAAFFLACGVVFMFFDPLLYYTVAGEDRILEALSAYLSFIAVLLAGCLAFSALRKKRVGRGFSWLAIALLFFVLGMEEVSWMQRIYHVDTPEYLLEVNRQRELNIHNIESIEAFVMRAYFLLYGLAFVILPTLFEPLQKALGRRAKKLTDKAAVFLPGQWMLVLAAIPFAFTAPAYQQEVGLLTFVAFVVAVLLYQAFRQLSVQPVFALGCLGVSAIILFVQLCHFIYPDRLLLPWFPLEYLEFFVAFSLFAYAFDKLVLHRSNQG